MILEWYQTINEGKRPTKEEVDNGLCSKLIDVMVNPSKSNLEHYSTMINVLGSMGYDVGEHKAYYRRFKDDYDNIISFLGNKNGK